MTALFLWALQSSGGGGAGAVGGRLPYDVARRFAQPLGIHLDEWKSRIIEIEKGAVRLLPVSERARQLFGAAGAGALADEIESSAGRLRAPQLDLFPEDGAAQPRRRQGRQGGGRGGGGSQSGELAARRDATTLDRVHAAMLFQDWGRSQALRGLIQSEQERGPDFLRLANALSVLYPNGSGEKRLVDAMLLAAPR